MHQNNPFTTLQLILARKETKANFTLTEINGSQEAFSQVRVLNMHSKQNNSQTPSLFLTHTHFLLHKYLYLLCNYSHQYVMVSRSHAVLNLYTLLCHCCGGLHLLGCF